tara:strand:- start:166 stop:423 length:258 start_codon:yes stop_codon:yes gene_type:complete
MDIKFKDGRSQKQEVKEMNLSDQALGALMMALQKSLLEQSDIVPTLKAFRLAEDASGELVVVNPPVFKVGNSDLDTLAAATETEE